MFSPIFVAVLLLSLRMFCHAKSISLTDKTFDSVREAFSHQSMLILAHSGGCGARGDARRLLGEFDGLSRDGLLLDGGIMAITVDVDGTPTLAARLGVWGGELPSLIYLHGDRLFRYQGKPSSADLMRSYALQGYLNQGEGEPMPDAGSWHFLKSKYMDWLFNPDASSGMHVNPMAVLLTGFVAGLSFCAAAVVLVLIFSKETSAGAEGNMTRKVEKTD